MLLVYASFSVIRKPSKKPFSEKVPMVVYRTLAIMFLYRRSKKKTLQMISYNLE